MRRRALIILTALCLAFSLSGFSGKTEPVQGKNTGAAARMSTGLSSDIARTGEHEEIT